MTASSNFNTLLKSLACGLFYVMVTFLLRLKLIELLRLEAELPLPLILTSYSLALKFKVSYLGQFSSYKNQRLLKLTASFYFFQQWWQNWQPQSGGGGLKNGHPSRNPTPEYIQCVNRLRMSFQLILIIQVFSIFQIITLKNRKIRETHFW